MYHWNTFRPINIRMRLWCLGSSGQEFIFTLSSSIFGQVLHYVMITITTLHYHQSIESICAPMLSVPR